MSQGYVGYDLQNGIRAELIKRGIYKPVCTVLTQVTVDPYDEAFYTPVKVVGRVMTKEEAEEEEAKGNHVKEVGGGYRRIVASPHPVAIVEIDAIKALMDADPDCHCMRRRRNPCHGAGLQLKGRQRHHREGPCNRASGQGD